jgi:hypothetical protein
MLHYNPDFNSIEFDGIKNAAGSNNGSFLPVRVMREIETGN